MEHKIITREKYLWKLGVHSMKESSEKAMEVNNEPRLNINEQQDDKTFSVKSDIDGSDEVHEVTAARTPMKNNRPVRLTCVQTLALKNGCKKSYWARAHWALGKLFWQNVQQ